MRVESERSMENTERADRLQRRITARYLGWQLSLGEYNNRLEILSPYLRLDFRAYASWMAKRDSEEKIEHIKEAASRFFDKVRGHQDSPSGSEL